MGGTLAWAAVAIGALGIFAGAIDGLRYGFAGSRSVARWIRAKAAAVISPWRATGRLKARLDSIERELATLKGPQPQPTAHYLLVRWQYIPHEAANGAFCDSCFVREGKLYRLGGKRDGHLVRLSCPNKQAHPPHFNIALQQADYDFGRRMQI